jgi:hypothetical protein
VITGVDSTRQVVQPAPPQWGVAIVLLAALAGLTLRLDALFHWLAATPELRVGLTASMAISGDLTGTVCREAPSSVRKRPLLERIWRRLPFLIGRFMMGPVALLRGAPKADLEPVRKEHGRRT